MVCYKCQKCSLEFYRKSNYVRHINKKFDCSPINKIISIEETKNQIIIPNIPINSKINPNAQNIFTSNSNFDLNLKEDVLDKDIKEVEINDNEICASVKSNFCCGYCLKSYSTKSNLNKHLSTNCKIKEEKDKDKNNKINEIKSENEYLKNQIDKIIQFNDNLIKQNKKNEKEIKELTNKIVKLTNNFKSKEFYIINDNIKKLEKTIPANSNLEISNQLVNKIIEKEKIIDSMDNEMNLISELLEDDIKEKIKGKITLVDDFSNKNLINNENLIKNENNCIDELDNKPINLILNNQIIQFRESDNYINATQLCKAGRKKLSHWLCLDNTKELINILASNAGIPALDLIDKKVGGNHNGTWIHPDLAIQLAQWLSPQFSIQVSLWIRELFTQGNVSINLKILKEKENIIKDSQRRIKILENLTLKKHKRTKYSDANIVYIVKDPENKNDRKYIIGSAKDLTTRLSTYNKGSEFEVIYYKGFKSEEVMLLAEKIVLSKLDQYREQANRDRFILPIRENIKLFTDVINESWIFFK
jgi:hypothetical protein